MKKILTVVIGSIFLLSSCSEERKVYNTSNHGYRHGRKTRYYRDYRGHAHRGDFNKGYNGYIWETR